MCDEKRAWFGVIDMTGEDPKTKYSFNPSAIQWWAWMFGKTIAIIAGLWLGVSWVAGGVFDTHLKAFHREAKPAIKLLVTETMESHERSHVTLERVHDIERHNAGVDEKLGNMEEKLDNIEGKIDILIRNGN